MCKLLKRCGVLVVLTSLCAACGAEATPEEPVVIVTTTDQGADQHGEARPDMVDMGADQDEEAHLLPDQSPDPGEDMMQRDDMSPQGCEPIELPDELTLGVGQGAVYEVSEPWRAVNASGGGLTARVETEGIARVHVRANYEAGARTFTLDLECARDGSRLTHQISVEVRALQVDHVENWGDELGPVRREHAPLLFHPDDPDALYMYGGLAYRPRQFTVITDFWRFDRQTLTWSQPEVRGEPPAAATGRFVYSARRGGFLTVGGDDNLRGTANTSLYMLTRDPQLGQWSWSDQEPEGELEHSLGALVYDEVEDELVAALGFGGIGATGYTFLDGAARLELGADELSWQGLATSANAPTPRYGFAYFVDPVTRRLVVTGGAQGLRTVDPATDTWAYDWRTNTWEQLAEVNVGGIFDLNNRHDGGRNACWAFDPVHRRLFVWGGTPDGRTISRGLYAMHLDEPGAVRWHAVSLDGFPATRASCSGGYNPARGEIYFGFGNSDMGVYQDLVFVKVHDV